MKKLTYLLCKNKWSLKIYLQKFKGEGPYPVENLNVAGIKKSV